MARPRQVSDDEILEAAREIFVDHGASASTHLVAERLGVSAAALFKRFGSKAELMRAALAPPRIPPWVELLAAGPDDRPLPEQLLEAVRIVDHFLGRMVPCLAVMREAGLGAHPLEHFRDQPEGEPIGPLAGLQAFEAWFQRAQQRGMARPMDAQVAAMMVISGVQSPHFFTHVLGDRLVGHDRERYLESLVETLWRGIAPATDPAR